MGQRNTATGEVATPPTLDVDADTEPTRRERLSVLIEQRLDVPMAVLAMAWGGLVAYELVAPPDQRQELRWPSAAIRWWSSRRWLPR